MNPFDRPPTTPLVDADPPLAPPPPDRASPASPEPHRRGRVVAVALAAAGLVAVGIAGVSQLVSADKPERVESAPSATSPSSVSSVPESSVPDDTAGEATEEPSDDRTPAVDGEIVIDTGDGDPIVIDLGRLGLDGEALPRFHECVGFPFPDGPRLPFEPRLLPPGSLFGDGSHVTVIGPDGVSIVDLGDEGSVTITRRDGETTFETDGDATVRDPAGVLEALPFEHDWLDGAWPDGERLEEWIGDHDPDRIEGCVDELLGE